MKKAIKEPLIFIIFALLQYILFALQFNPLITLMFVPLYTFFAKENFALRFVISYIVAAAVLGLVGKPQTAFAYMLIVYIVPLAIHILLKYKKGYVLDFSILTGGFLIYQVLSIKAVKHLYRVDIVNGLISFLKNMLGEYFKDLNEPVLIDKFAEFIKLMVPGFVIIEAITLGIVAYFLVKWSSKRLRIEKDFLNFEKLFMPREVTVGVVVFFILSFFLTQVNLLYVVASNMMIILSWLLFIQSLSLIYAAAVDRVSSSFFRNLIMFIVIIFGIQFFVVMILVGFLDLVFDFKKRNPKRVKL
ncbi:DUF2232 domain-containing protein [Caldicellulosiruptor morganii]|uniref:YybS family protein n=1 Tax=Caldicellulosiruptor morganii TaxID=1387555 RepID=A0ABY7BLE8_9FIRM|nr:DUF2232 domain-containing protein [Caldicellulosiruptor morganii]WAM33223.1 YybS family protein [Caldicellulosiruptor morganii]